MMQVFQTLLLVGGVLTALQLVLLALPQSKLRDVLTPIVGWLFAIACCAYVVSPIDIVPEALTGPLGLVDDTGALIAGLMAARAARNAGRANAQRDAA